MRWVGLFLLCFVSNLVTVAQDETACVVDSRLSVGDFARVTPGEANNVREEPAETAALVGQIPGGGLFEVIGEAVCDDRFVWIEAAYDDFTGWTVEANAESYWVEPVEGEVYADEVIQFVYPEDYLETIRAHWIEPHDQMGGFYPARQAYELTFETDVIVWRRYIFIMHADEISDEAPLALESLAELEVLLEEQPEFNEPVVETTDPNQPPAEIAFPQDPLFLGARRFVVAAPHYIESDEGLGVAFVTFYAQDLLPVTNDSIFYNFLGLAADGEYYLMVRLPIRTEILPDTYDDFEFPNIDQFGVPVGWADSYGSYIADITSQLTSLNPDEWEPSMNVLDDIVRSIQIVGDFES